MSRHRSREDEIRILARRAKVANLLLRGTVNQQEILRQLGMEPDQHSTVSKDIKAIKAEWRERTVDDFGEARQREADRLLLMMGEYMAAWERSKVEKQSTRTKRKTRPGRADGNRPPVPETSDEAEVKKEFRDGNAAFLDGAFKCHVRLCELFGLDEPKRVKHVGDEDAPPIKVEAVVKVKAADLSTEELRLLLDLRKRLAGNPAGADPGRN
jgi:hypothetical protein